MLDARLQARLAQNYADAAVGYTNASVAAMSAIANRTLAFWMPAPETRQTPSGRRDHLSWFDGQRASRRPEPASTDALNPWAAFNFWTSAMTSAMQPRPTNPSMMAMAMSFGPFAAWWSQALGTPNFAWPMAYQMIASGVPESVAWPTAEANAAVLDAAVAVKQEVEQAFASYQSAGGFAMAHILPPAKPTALALTAFAPFAAFWSMAANSTTGVV